MKLNISADDAAKQVARAASENAIVFASLRQIVEKAKQTGAPLILVSTRQLDALLGHVETMTDAFQLFIYAQMEELVNCREANQQKPPAPPAG